MRILPQLLVIVEVFITEGQAIDPLGHQLFHRVFNQIGIPIIPEAGGKLAHDSDAFLDFSQQQPASFGRDGPTVKLSLASSSTKRGTPPVRSWI
jgi:hypothetical protein